MKTWVGKVALAAMIPLLVAVIVPVADAAPPLPPPAGHHPPAPIGWNPPHRYPAYPAYRYPVYPAYRSYGHGYGYPPGCPPGYTGSSCLYYNNYNSGFGPGWAAALALSVPMAAASIYSATVSKPAYAPPYVIATPTYAGGTVVYPAPPPVVQTIQLQRQVCYPHGCYYLNGDGYYVAYQWVWVPAPPSPAPPPPSPAPPPLPGAPGQ